MKKLTLTLLIVFVTVFPFYAQSVTTFTDGTPDDGIAIDTNGNIYCSNYLGDTVFKFTPSGEMSSFITGLNTSNGLAFDSNDNLYVCDGQGHIIYKYDINGNQLDSYPITGNPSGIIKSFDDDSMIFTIHTNNSIHKLSPEGTITNISLSPEIDTPVGLAMDENGIIYVGNYSNRVIYRFLENGDVEYIAQLPTDGGALPNLGFITYGQGFLWGTTMGSDKIYKINPNAIDEYELFAGSSQGSLDGDISVATFHTPNGIAFNDNQDTMYITDFGSKNLRILSGIVLSTNTNELKKSDVVIYPNPVVNKVNIDTKIHNDSNYKITVSDVLGKTIFTFDGISDNLKIATTINMESWNKGIYFLKLEVGKSMITKKIVR